MNKSFFSVIFSLVVMNCFAQYDYRDSNRFGINAGEQYFRANISYQYKLVNVLSPLNSDNPDKNCKGNSSILNGNIIIYF